MMKILTSSSMKIAEAIAVERGSSYLALMENAGTAAVQRVLALLGREAAGQLAVIFCGKGNNGGDGLVMARQLLQAGMTVTVLFPLGMQEEKFTPLARANLHRLQEWQEGRLTMTAHPSEQQLEFCCRNAAVIVDAVFGTGFSGSLPAEVVRLFQAAEKSCGLLAALDIPSGINCDSGEGDPDSFPAEVTFAFGALKPAHLLKRSALRCGRIERLDIGISRSAIDSLPEGITPLTRTLAASCLPRRNPDSHKGSYGRLLNVGGCGHMTGAVMLSTLSALSGGVGLCKVAAPESMIPVIAGRILPCIYAPLPANPEGAISYEGIDRLSTEMSWANALLLGCGLSVCEDTRLLVEELVTTSNIPMVLDADALNCLAGQTQLLKKAKAPAILTPHLLEMARLTGESVELCRARRFDIAASFAREYGVVVVLKDSTTVIASPEGALYMTVPVEQKGPDGFPCTYGNSCSGLAKGGSGDLLAGLAASLLSQGAEPLQAALAAVWLHATAGDLCEEEMTAYCMQPTDVLHYYPAAFHQLLG